MTSSSEQKQKERILSISSCYDCPNRMEMVCLYKPLGMVPMPSGKEAFDYRNRYVCTEKDDQEITDDLPYWCPLPRPHPAPSTVVEDITFEGAAIVQAARSEASRKAREDDIAALDSLVDTRKSRYEDPSEPEDRKEFLRGMSEGAQMARSVIKALRTTTPHTPAHPPEAQQRVKQIDKKLCQLGDMIHEIQYAGKVSAEVINDLDGVLEVYREVREAIALLQAGRE